MKYPQARLLIFAKAPIEGTVKTRLAADWGKVKATQLYRQMLDYTITQAVKAALCPVELWCAPNTQHAVFQYYQQHWGITLQSQQGLDLGERMSMAIASTLTSAECCLLIGTDCPALTAMDLEHALSVLANGEQVIFNPAEDGGYVALGMRQLIPSLFTDIPWSTHQVMQCSREQMLKLGIDWQELKTYWDVDQLKDVQRLHQCDWWQSYISIISPSLAT